ATTSRETDVPCNDCFSCGLLCILRYLPTVCSGLILAEAFTYTSGVCQPTYRQVSDKVSALDPASVQNGSRFSSRASRNTPTSCRRAAWSTCAPSSAIPTLPSEVRHPLPSQVLRSEE